METFIFCTVSYSRIPGGTWSFYKDEPVLDNNGIIVCFADNNSIDIDLFKFKEKIMCQAGDNATKNVEIMMSLKYLSN